MDEFCRQTRWRGEGAGASLAELSLEAVANLRGQGRRSVLALLGVVIGSAAIVALMNVAHIAQIQALESFRQTGVDMLSIQIEGSAGEGLDVAGLDTLARQDREVVLAAPFAVTGQAVRLGATSAGSTVAGITPVMNDVAGLSVVEGRLLRDVDGCSPVAVLGHKLAQTLSSPGARLYRAVWCISAPMGTPSLVSWPRCRRRR